MGEGAPRPETDHVGRRTEGALEIIGAAGVSVIEGGPLQDAPLPAHGVIDMDGAETVVAAQLTSGDFRGRGRGVHDHTERTSAQVEITIVQTVGDVGARIIQQDGASGVRCVPTIEARETTGGTEHEGAIAHDDLVGSELTGRRSVDVEVDGRPFDDADGRGGKVRNGVEINGAATAEGRGIGPGADASEVEGRARGRGPHGTVAADVGDSSREGI